MKVVRILIAFAKVFRYLAHMYDKYAHGAYITALELYNLPYLAVHGRRSLRLLVSRLTELFS
jgi:hypothetical protein